MTYQPQHGDTKGLPSCRLTCLGVFFAYVFPSFSQTGNGELNIWDPSLILLYSHRASPNGAARNFKGHPWCGSVSRRTEPRARGHPFKTQEVMTSFPTPGHLSHTVHTQWLSVLSHKAEEFSTWSDSVRKRKTRARSLYGFLPLFTHSCSPCACTQATYTSHVFRAARPKPETHETRNSENTSDVFPSLSHTLMLHPNDPCRFHL